jgi:hypothetical protein
LQIAQIWRGQIAVPRNKSSMQRRRLLIAMLHNKLDAC